MNFNTIKKVKAKTLSLLVLLFLLPSLFFIYANYFSYFDPVNLCYISIDNYSNKPPGGNRDTVRKAINLIKDSDSKGYKILCKNVDTVQEGYCDKPDENGHFEQIPPPGCYIRGTKIIFVVPEKSNENNVVLRRAETIKKYANLSKRFWDNY